MSIYGTKCDADSWCAKLLHHVMKHVLTMLLLSHCLILSAQGYRIGDVYTAPDGSKGIVYYVNPDGSGGWAVALTDASGPCAWGDVTDVTGLANQNTDFTQQLLYDTAGYANTQAMRSYQNNNAQYAAGKVDFSHGWVLPSPAQLSMLYARLPFISTALTQAGGSMLINYNNFYYWTSAEKDASEAWSVSSITGCFVPYTKGSMCRVRAVRRFTYGPSYLWSTGDSTASVTVAPSQTSSYTVTVTTLAGCTDQGYTTVAVVQPQTDILYDVVCQGVPYSANGFTLSAAETDTAGTLVLKREVPNTFCTDTVMLMLTVNPKVYTNLTHSACDSYTWNGETYHESGSYSITLSNANGCDSVVTLQLTIFQTPDTAHVRMTTCDSYVWHGETLTQPGVYTHTLESAGGCDSVVVLHLRVESVPEVSVHPAIDTICPGDTTVLQAIVDNDSLFAPPPPPPVAIGDILCTDGTTVKLDQFPSSGKTAMGVVFYVDTTDQHGWAMHLQEQDSVQWCCFPHYASQYLADIPELTNFDAGSLALYDLDGYHNTQVIRSFTNTGSIAPADCFLAAYSVDFDNGWYLPAIGQLRVLYGVSLMINPSLLAVGGTPFLQEGTNIHSWDSGYWSSTEQSRYYVLFLQSTGIIKSSGKNSGGAGYRVRAVRNF